MKFTADAKVFLRAADPAIDVATKNTTKQYPFAEKVTIKAAKDSVTLYSHGGAAAMIAPISGAKFDQIHYECLKEGTVTVPAASLAAAIASLPSGDVSFQKDGGELKIFAEEDCVRSLPVYDETVVPGGLGDSHANMVQINREVLLQGIKKVAFAMAVEEKMYQYHCVFIEFDKKGITFLAGSGGRFVIYQVMGGGDKVITFEQEGQLYLSKQNISNVKNFLQNTSCEAVVLRHIEANPGKGVPEQVTVEADGQTMCIYNVGQFSSPPPYARILKNPYTNEMWTDLDSWKLAVKGSAMTKGLHDGIHNTVVKLDRAKKKLMVESQTKHKSRTPISLDMSECTFSEDGTPYFKANTLYFEDMVACVEGNPRIFICFESQERIEGVTDEAELKELMVPVLVSYPENPNALMDTVESLYMFFVLSTK